MKINMVSEDFSVWEISGFDLPDIEVDSGELYHQADSIPPLRNVVEITKNKELFYSTWEKNTKIIEDKVKLDSIDNLLIKSMSFCRSIKNYTEIQVYIFSFSKINNI